MASDLPTMIAAAIIAALVIIFILRPVLQKMSDMAENVARHEVLTAEEILESGKAPVLYLRPFQIDGSKASGWKVFSVFGLSTPTEEAELVALLRGIGPVVAIGFPGEKIAGDYGAARAQCPNHGWQEFVLNWMKHSTLIVIVVGKTSGVAWELQSICHYSYLSKTIFILDESIGEPNELLLFLKLNLGDDGTILSNNLNSNSIIYLPPNEEPTVIYETFGVLNSKRIHALKKALKSWKSYRMMA